MSEDYSKTLYYEFVHFHRKLKSHDQNAYLEKILNVCLGDTSFSYITFLNRQFYSYNRLM